MCFSNVVEMFKNGEISDQTNFDMLTENWSYAEREGFWDRMMDEDDDFDLLLAPFAREYVCYLDEVGRIDYAGIADEYFKQDAMGVRDFTIKAICTNAGNWLPDSAERKVKCLKAKWEEFSDLWYWPHVFERCVADLNYYNGYAIRVARAKRS